MPANKLLARIIANPVRLIGLFFIAETALLLAFSISNVLFGVLYDTDHFGDTIFLLGAGWRTYEGLTPVIDFGHFYGGVMAEGIAITMQLFGPDVFAFEVFTIILLAFLALLSTIILHRRISITGWAALVLTIAVLMLSRYPLEMNEPITRIISTHSFLYNRFGLALLLVSGIFVALRAPAEQHDRLPGVLVGILIVLAALTKPTFIVLLPGVALGLALQRRWQALVAVFVGICISVAILDPTLQRWLGSLAYIQAQVGDQDSADVGALLRKAVQLPLSQPVATTFALAAVGLLVVTRTQLASVLGLLIIAGAGIGMATTMGGNGSLGQLALPVAILIALAAGEIAMRAGLHHSSFVQMIAYALVMALALPHMLNLAGATLEGVAKREQTLISEGPYQRYLSIPEGANDQTAPTQYEMFADGIAALHSLGDPSRWGIVADHGVTFEHAVLGRPVPGYPLWQRATAPELAEDMPIAPESDIVMIGRSDPPSEIGAILRAKFGEEFALCTMSMHWEIYVRRTSGIQC
jgi:hypothetical protein